MILISCFYLSLLGLSKQCECCCNASLSFSSVRIKLWIELYSGEGCSIILLKNFFRSEQESKVYFSFDLVRIQYLSVCLIINTECKENQHKLSMRYVKIQRIKTKITFTEN